MTTTDIAELRELREYLKKRIHTAKICGWKDDIREYDGWLTLVDRLLAEAQKEEKK